jgi:hypothetical protein
LTGDVEAAQVLVALADAVVSENIDWDAPGKLHAYSYHPKYSASAAYYPQVLPMFFAAHELSGADRFEEAARAVWATWASSEHFPDDRITTDQAANTLWMLPWLAHWGQAYGLFSSPDDAVE